MLVLGINCTLSPTHADFMARWWPLHYHDAAAALVRDGEVVAAVEQERLNRIKHTTAFAGDAIQACLEFAGASLTDVDRVAFFFGEHYTDRELYRLYARSPRLPVRSSRELLAERLQERFDTALPDEVLQFVEHHTAHAFTAYPQSGYDDALVAVLDGAGEENAISVYSGHGPAMELLTSHDISHSLGYLYLTGTELLGYGLGDEYKVMGLAPHGNPATYRAVFTELYDLLPDGDFRLNYEDLHAAFARVGFTPRRKGEHFTPAHRDFAAGLQETLESIAWHVITHWQRATGHRRLAIAGGVGQNCTFNGKLLLRNRFDEVFVHPAAHDAGAALGAALKAHVDLGGAVPRRRVRQVFWGPALPAPDEVTDLLTRWKRFVRFERSTDVARDTASLLAEDRVVGWVQGRSEFGPRALGNRSILADPRPERNRDRVNRMIKQREGYRPFAPSVRAEDLHTYFEFPRTMPTPDFMVFTVPVRAEHRAELGAVTHVDGTARVHAVDQEVNPLYWRLLTEFGAHTGVPVLLNTSFNNHAEPIVDSAEDALRCYLTTQIDHLVIGDLIVTKLPWSHADLCSLAPTLSPNAKLVREDTPGQPPTLAITFAYGSTKEAPLEPDVYEVLRRADGVSSLHALGVADDESGHHIAATVRDLWSERFIDLTPPPRRSTMD
ncbi:carbamoyltransferase family protein [Streptoalloteichus hindustanus]|nr:carbamoyltransferase C-terminal domain-containing protein [Streptoalloteichus hindustanus]